MKTIIVPDLKYKSPCRRGRGTGAKGLRHTLKYVEYREDYTTRASPERLRDRWQDRGLDAFRVPRLPAAVDVTDTPTEVVPTEVPTEDVPTDTPTEVVPTEVPTEDVPTDTPPTEDSGPWQETGDDPTATPEPPADDASTDGGGDSPWQEVG